MSPSDFNVFFALWMMNVVLILALGCTSLSRPLHEAITVNLLWGGVKTSNRQHNSCPRELCGYTVHSIPSYITPCTVNVLRLIKRSL